MQNELLYLTIRKSPTKLLRYFFIMKNAIEAHDKIVQLNK